MNLPLFVPLFLLLLASHPRPTATDAITDELALMHDQRTAMAKELEDVYYILGTLGLVRWMPALQALGIESAADLPLVTRGDLAQMEMPAEDAIALTDAVSKGFPTLTGKHLTSLTVQRLLEIASAHPNAQLSSVARDLQATALELTALDSGGGSGSGSGSGGSRVSSGSSGGGSGDRGGGTHSINRDTHLVEGHRTSGDIRVGELTHLLPDPMANVNQRATRIKGQRDRIQILRGCDRTHLRMSLAPQCAFEPWAFIWGRRQRQRGSKAAAANRTAAAATVGSSDTPQTEISVILVKFGNTMLCSSGNTIR